jgi:hypothetical protein
MYALETTEYGFKITLDGRVTFDEAKQAFDESSSLLKTCRKPFGVLVDIRTLKPMLDDVQASVDETQRLFRANGLQRSAVVLASAIMTMQFTRIAKDTGIYNHERYVNAGTVPNWHDVALAWIVDGVDPDHLRGHTPRM